MAAPATQEKPAEAPAASTEKIKIPKAQYDILATLLKKGEVGKPITDVQGIPGLRALATAGYIKILKEGDTPGRGRAGKPILSLSVVKGLDAYDAGATRGPRKGGTASRKATSEKKLVLTVAALEKFLSDLKGKIKTLEPVVMAEAEKTYQAAYKALPTDAKGLSAAENINRVKDFNDATAALQEASKTVVKRALAEINAQDYQDLRSPVTDLIDLMTEK